MTYAVPGCRDPLRRDIHTGYITVREMRQKLPAATPDFQNAGLRWNQMAVIFRKKGTVKTSKPCRTGWSRVVELPNAIEIRTH